MSDPVLAYAGHLFVWPNKGFYELTNPQGVMVASCTSYASLLAAYRLLGCAR
jgi:hypothetical protein